MESEERELELQRMQTKIDEDKENVKQQIEQVKVKERLASSLKAKYEKERAELDAKHAKDLSEINAAAMQKLMMGGAAGAALVVLMVAFFLMK